MESYVVGVALFAALWHAAWNFLVKRSDDPYQGMTSIVFGHAPFGLIAVLCCPPITSSAWTCIVTGARSVRIARGIVLVEGRCGDINAYWRVTSANWLNASILEHQSPFPGITMISLGRILTHTCSPFRCWVSYAGPRVNKSPTAVFTEYSITGPIYALSITTPSRQD